MNKPKFSIIIPTKNRAKTLKYTLLTCINQKKFDDYEIIISDNQCTDDTEEMVRNLNCNKIVYIKTSKPLSMRENYEFALSHSRGKYKIIIGSDDGLILHCLYTLDKIINITSEDVFNWNEFSYNWPDLNETGNKLYIDEFYCNTKIINGMNLVNGLINFKSGLPKFSPQLYRHATVTESIVEQIKNNNESGNFFNAPEPDIYSGMCIASLKKKFLSLGIKLSISGMSYMSSSLNAKKEGIKSQALIDFMKYDDDNTSMFPMVACYACAIERAFKKIKIEYPQLYNDIELDERKVINNIVEELIELSNYEYLTFCLNYMYKVLESDKKLQLWFKEKYIDKYSDKEKIQNDMKAVKSKVGKVDFASYEGAVLDGDYVGFSNIYEVAMFLEKSFYNEKFIETYIQQFEYKWNKCKTVMDEISGNASGKNVGIYGIGSHSEILLEIYEYFKGKIDFNIIFFDSNDSKWGSKFMGYDVHSPAEIANLNLDKIIISSRTYQNEIYELIKKYEHNLKIIKLYDKSDLFYLKLV